jgi:hydroxyacylglutathione hydrolase
MRQHTVQTPYMVGEAHFYSTEINGELVLFDTGPATAEAVVYLKEQVDLDRLKYVFITHCHVDHYGLAAYIGRNSGAEVCIPRKDAIKLQRHEERLMHIQAILHEYGFDEAFVERLRGSFEKIRIFPNFPEKFSVVEESKIMEQLGITWLSCPGHSQSDLVYLWGGHAIAGDVLIRTIFQAPLLDVDLTTFAGRFKNYDAYCTSLLNLHKLAGYEIHPGHREYVKNSGDTILFYVRKLLERAAQVKRFSNVESIHEVVGLLFGEALVEPFYIYLKASEIVFMRDFLAQPEKLKSSLERIGLFEAVRDLYNVVTAKNTACCTREGK